MKTLTSKIISRTFTTFLFIFVLSLVLPYSAVAGEWRVIPIRLDFSKKEKSGVVTVKNTGDEALHVSISAKAWSQDEMGKDIYEEASDIVFFPKVLMIKPKSERVVRVGIKAPAVKQEKAYRLFLTEQKPPSQDSSQVAVALRFGIPVFAEPLEKNYLGEIDGVELSNGYLSFVVRNRGNAHFRTTRIDVIGKDASGQQLFAQELKGWYLLPGKEQPHQTELPPELRSQLSQVEIRIETDRMELFESVAYREAPKVPLKVE